MVPSVFYINKGIKISEIKIDSRRAKDPNSLFYVGFTKTDIERDIREISETSDIIVKDFELEHSIPFSDL